MTTYLQISSGQGPKECRRAVRLTVAEMRGEAASLGLTFRPMDINDAYASVLLELTGETAKVFAASWVGTVQWVFYSPYRTECKRKNWYISIKEFSPCTKQEADIKDIRFETMRAAGPGGQHVNRTESAVRAVHIPTGLVARAEEERSQSANKRLALLRLFLLLDAEAEKAKELAISLLRQNHYKTDRGALHVVRKFSCLRDGNKERKIL